LLGCKDICWDAIFPVLANPGKHSLKIVGKTLHKPIDLSPLKIPSYISNKKHEIIFVIYFKIQQLSYCILLELTKEACVCGLLNDKGESLTLSKS
jgi:hypothetical protein